jgi:ABC-type nitrate/sulfonate/bicarbonate transport system substrate-binding protein
MKKYLTIIGVLLLITSIFATKNVFLAKNSSVEKIKINVRLKWIHQAQFAGFYVAREKGYYDDEGLDVTLDPGGPDISPTQTVLTGADQFGVIGADQILLAREKNVPLRSIAVIYKQSPVAIASLKESKITSASDFRGKTIAVVYGKDEEVIYKALLEKNNINRADIKEVPLLFDLSQLTTKKVDAQIVYEINEPILLRQKGFNISLIKPRDYGINFYSDTIFTTDKMINNQPEVVSKFMRATKRGWEEAINNQDEAINFVLKYNNSLNREHQSEFLKLSIPLIIKDSQFGFSEIDGWKNMQELMLKQGVMKKEVVLDDAFTNKYLY